MDAVNDFKSIRRKLERQEQKAEHDKHPAGFVTYSDHGPDRTIGMSAQDVAKHREIFNRLKASGSTN